MATIGDIVVNIRARTDQLSKGIGKARKQIGDFGKSVGITKQRVTAFTAVAAGGASAFTAWGLALAGAKEQAVVSMKVMLGSEKAAKGMIDAIQRFAAETPFEQADLIEATKKLLAFGVEQQNVMRDMKMLGDIAAISGNSIGDLALIYGKVQATGRASMEEINQLSDRSVPIFEKLKEQLGVTGEQFRKMVAGGEINKERFNAALQSMASEGGKFHNGMKQQSETLSGLWSTFNDNIKLVAQTFGEILLPIAKRVLKEIISLLEKLNKSLQTRHLQFQAMTGQITPEQFMLEMTRLTLEHAGAGGGSSGGAPASSEPASPRNLGTIPGMGAVSGMFAIAESIKAAVGSLKPKRQEVSLAGAFEKGTISAMQAIERGRQKTAAVRLQKQQLEAAKQANMTLGQINQAVRASSNIAIAQL